MSKNVRMVFSNLRSTIWPGPTVQAPPKKDIIRDPPIYVASIREMAIL